MSTGTSDLSRAIIALFGLPIVTSVLYIYAYSFEVGYAAYFGYPIGILPFGIEMILNWAVYLFAYAYILFLFLQINLQSWPNTRGAIGILMVGGIVTFGLLIGLKVFFPWVTPYGVFVPILFSILGTFVLRRMSTKASVEPADSLPMLSVYDRRSRVPQDSIAHAILIRLGFDPLIYVLVFLIVLPSIFWIAGFVEGRSERKFYLFEEHEVQYIVLRMLDGQAVSARYDSRSKKYDREFIVRQTQSLRSIKPFTLEK